MISYAKHEEEFYGVFKLVSGEEVLGKAVLTEDSGETLCFVQNPVSTVVINNKDDSGRNIRGVGFAKWMQFSDEDFYIIREKDVLTVSSMSKEISFMYEAFIQSETKGKPKKDDLQINPEPNMGYLGKIDKARNLFEKIYKFDPIEPK
ncbi:methylamine utilization protein [Prochlorococcus phage P-SSM7]|uniref:Methylamine utilization protein n=1 Tax=Prochlorococcus phage P-SSM7 TaxID=445688 RepID=E3SNQ0_9CAUD|nr:methylamine utilization [Prochlorococcus phage P-SSM7]ADO98971.1 methylamine utilization protein [Prochlorococcus phage P-SSM7]